MNTVKTSKGALWIAVRTMYGSYWGARSLMHQISATGFRPRMPLVFDYELGRLSQRVPYTSSNRIQASTVKLQSFGLPTVCTIRKSCIRTLRT